MVRDAWVLDLLGDAVARGERVFAVMGARHVVVQEPALRPRSADLPRVRCDP